MMGYPKGRCIETQPGEHPSRCPGMRVPVSRSAGERHDAAQEKDSLERSPKRFRNCCDAGCRCLANPAGIRGGSSLGRRPRRCGGECGAHGQLGRAGLGTREVSAPLCTLRSAGARGSNDAVRRIVWEQQKDGHS